ncbi:MAG: transglycosylase family protein [Actinobacteria bacterium]|nr:transglycosylase family protein [Actinomycetota bacterium]
MPRHHTDSFARTRALRRRAGLAAIAALGATALLPGTAAASGGAAAPTQSSASQQTTGGSTGGSHPSGGAAAQPTKHKKKHKKHKKPHHVNLPAELQKIAMCESGDDPTAVSPDGRYRGKYQFDYPTWYSVGGQGDPAQAPEWYQDKKALKLYHERGTAPWPNCA